VEDKYLWIGGAVGLVVLWFAVRRRDSKYFWIALALLVTFLVLLKTRGLGWAIGVVVGVTCLVLFIRRKRRKREAQVYAYTHHDRYAQLSTRILNEMLVSIDRDKKEIEHKILLYRIARPDPQSGDYNYDLTQSKINDLVFELEHLEVQEKDIKVVLRERGCH